jgi:hypothetical protein
MVTVKCALGTFASGDMKDGKITYLYIKIMREMPIPIPTSEAIFVESGRCLKDQYRVRVLYWNAILIAYLFLPDSLRRGYYCGVW